MPRRNGKARPTVVQLTSYSLDSERRREQRKAAKELRRREKRGRRRR